MTDQEFAAAITKLRLVAPCETLIEVYDYALELVKRPATGAQLRARQRKLEYYRAYNKRRSRRA